MPFDIEDLIRGTDKSDLRCPVCRHGLEIKVPKTAVGTTRPMDCSNCGSELLLEERVTRFYSVKEKA